MVTSSIRDLFHNQLTEQPKAKAQTELTGYHNQLGWVFLSNDFVQTKSVRTYGTLFVMGEDYEYFTPNTFYRKDKRRKGTLRWLNSMSIDIDVKNGENEGIGMMDIFDKITIAGLPVPSIIVRTPSGGFHIHWFFEKARRASRKMNKHYTRIQTRISELLGGDVEALGPERFFRLPTEANTIFTSTERPSFDFFYDWFDIQIQEENEERKAYKQGFCTVKGLLNHPAIQKIMQGVEKGKRDNACFTLALAHKAVGYSQTETEGILQKWNLKNTPAMSWVQVNRKVKSAFQGDYHGPSSFHIRELSGMEFSYVKWEAAKPRDKRTYSHLHEWEKDVVKFIKRHKGSISGSQRSLAESIKSSVDKTKSIPFTTLKKVLASLEEQGKLQKDVQGNGRNAVTTLTLVEAKKTVSAPSKEKKQESNKKLMGSIPNTFKDWAVGGSALALDSFPLKKFNTVDITPTISRPSALAPVPRNVPDSFVSALFNRGFTDGRFVFGAWGRIQLGFKALGIPFRAISLYSDYLSLAVEAVQLTVDEKGSLLRGDFQGDDHFFKYLFGTVKGLLTNLRNDVLTAFIAHIEDLSDIRLLGLGMELEAKLSENNEPDRELLLSQLREIEAEQSARERRKVYQERFWEDSSLHTFRYFLKKD